MAPDNVKYSMAFAQMRPVSIIYIIIVITRHTHFFLNEMGLHFRDLEYLKMPQFFSCNFFLVCCRVLQ